MTATLRAWKQHFIKGRKSKSKVPVKQKWSKTDHEFLAKSILQRYHRNLGDVLLEKGFIQRLDLEKALQKSSQSGKKLGEVLIENKIITEMQLLSALASVKGTVMIPKIQIYIADDEITLDQEIFMENIAFPVINKPNICILTVCADSSENAAQEFSKLMDKKIQLIYAPKEAIINAINNMGMDSMMNFTEMDHTKKLLDSKNISEEQALLVQKYTYILSSNELYTLEYMGLMTGSNVNTDEDESESLIYMGIMPQQVENQLS